MTKLSDLSALAGADVVAADDLIHAADMSETGVARSKKMTFAELKVAIGAYTPGGTDVAVADGGTGASSAGAARTNLDVYSKAEVDGLVGDAGVMEWAPNFLDDATVYIPISVAMTIDEGNAALGTGSLAVEKSTAADPDTFSSVTLPEDIEAGAWVKLIVTGVSGFYVPHIVRTA